MGGKKKFQQGAKDCTNAARESSAKDEHMK